MRILIFGLPGSGKTTLAKAVAERLRAVHLNADDMRTKVWPGLDFSREARLIQAQRISALAGVLDAQGFNVIMDFICPTNEIRKLITADSRIWVDRIKEGRFADTNAMFEAPEYYDLRIRNGMTIRSEVSHVLDSIRSHNGLHQAA